MILGRLGRMAYINTLPVDWGLVHSPLGKSVKVYRGTPTTLNRLLAEGRLDVSAVSSVAAIEHAEEWVVLDHLCIGCRGEVGSVILHSDRPVEQLNGRSIAVTAASATAARLLEVLLARHWKVDADLVAQDRPAPARLLIGDTALRTAQSGTAGFIYDLGLSWREFTGQNFVFGLWCIRREFVQEYPGETRALYHLLQTSYAMGRAHREGVIAEASHIAGLDRPTLHAYFEKLVYDLDQGLWAGLNTFINLLGYGRDRLRTYGMPKPRLSNRKEMTVQL
ncbi:MAG: menaquinone biosynthetic enzyme MqnA/MqnD family protein [Desulfomonilaceae bacterium]